MSVSLFYQADLAVLHQQLKRHQIAQAHLSGRDIKLDGARLAETDVIELPAPIGNLSTLEFANLFFAFNGSRVHAQAHTEGGSDDAPPGLYFTVINPQLLQSKNRSGIFEEETSKAGLFVQSLYIDHFFLRAAKSGAKLGSIAIALCAITALLRGFGSISLVAAGGKGFDERYIGFNVWPKFGFDAKIFPGELDDAPHLNLCRTVQDVVRMDPEWWRANGSQRLMKFDLAPHSTSWRKLIPYVHQKVLS